MDSDVFEHFTSLTKILPQRQSDKANRLPLDLYRSGYNKDAETQLSKLRREFAMMYPKRRGQKGSIAEFGPALILILIVFLFPMIDLIYLGIAYAAGWYCNHLVIREVACHNPCDAAAMGTCITTATNAWGASGLSNFIGNPNVVNNVTFTTVTKPTAGGNETVQSSGLPYPVAAPVITPAPGNSTYVGYCTVTTSMAVKPFVSLPWIGDVPGINQPVTFNFGDTRPQEEKGIT